MIAAERLVQQIRAVAPSEREAADCALIRRFHEQRDEDAFAELVRRHGPLVFGACRRVLGDGHAAEDAFQATFLLLARRAARLTQPGSLAGWLYVTAVRVAQAGRRSELRRRQRERQAVRPVNASTDDLTWREIRERIDAEIASLPVVYRQPLILCYLQDFPQAEAAKQLGVRPAVLRGRLERGRTKLRRRLEKLGLPLAAPILLLGTEALSAAVRDATLATVRDALAGRAVAPSVQALAASGSTLAAKWSVLAVAAILVLTVGVVLGRGGPTPEQPAAPPPKAQVPQAKPAVDGLGDPLPPGAILRLGTLRHRVQNFPFAWQSRPEGMSYLTQHGSEIRRVDADSGRVLEAWPVPNNHPVVGFSPDGRYLLTATRRVFTTGARLKGKKYTQDFVLTLYDQDQRKAVWTKTEKIEDDVEEWKWVDTCRFSPDGKYIATGTRHGLGSTRLWNAATGAELWSGAEKGQGAMLHGFANGGKSLVLRRATGNAIVILDRATGNELRSFSTMSSNAMRGCFLLPDGAYVAMGTDRTGLRVWDVATGQERISLGGQMGSVHCVAFTRDGRTVVTGGAESSLKVREFPSGKFVRRIDLGREGVRNLALCGDAPRVAVQFSGEQALHFFDLTTGKAIPPTGDGHNAAVNGIAIAPDGTLVSGSADATVRTWDVTTGKATGRLPIERDSNGAGFAMSRDGKTVAVANSANDTVFLYDRGTGKLQSKLPGSANCALNLAFSPDGRWLAAAAGYANGNVQVWDVATNRSVLQESVKCIYGLSFTFSPNSGQFAFEDDTRVRFFDTATWKEQPHWDKVYAPAMGLAYSPDGRMLATFGEGIRLYELATHKLRAHISPKVYQWSAMRFSPSGRYLAWVSHGTTIQIYDVHRGELLPTLTGHDDAITGLAFTADERAIASSSADSTILLWRLPPNAQVARDPSTPDTIQNAWRDLASDDGAAAFKAVRTLADSPAETVKWLAATLKAADPVDAKQLESHLRDLDNAKFAERDRATRSVEVLGDRAIPALEQFLAGTPTPEARRRAEQILEKARYVADHDRMRQARTLEVLERIGGDDAVKLLERLANGNSDAVLTRDAKSTLQRLRPKP